MEKLDEIIAVPEKIKEDPKIPEVIQEKIEEVHEEIPKKKNIKKKIKKIAKEITNEIIDDEEDSGIGYAIPLLALAGLGAFVYFLSSSKPVDASK